MKGIQVTELGKPDVLKYGDLPNPIIQSDQVLIEVRGASVNYADIKARSGAYHLGKKPPFIPGIDVAGVVLEVGRNVVNIKQGDHVLAFPVSGTYAEKTVANQELTFVIPETLDFVEAAAASLVAGTVTHMLKQVACINEHESLLIHAAAGGVGSTALQLAKAFGVSRLIASIGSPWKEDHVRKMGAAGVVDYLSESYAQDVIDMTDGQGVDVILSPLGGETIDTDLQCLAPFGRLVIFGEMNDGKAHLPANALYPTNRSILGCSFGHHRKFRPDSVRETMNNVIEMLAARKIEIYVNKCFHLEEAAQAHQFLENRQSLGKVVLVPGKFFRQDVP